MESLHLSDIENKVFADLFTAHDVNNCKKVSGKIASELFYKSGLSPSELHKITELCGAKRLGYFGRSQFYIALRLIALAQANQPVSIEALQTKTNNLQLPRFDVVGQEKEEESPEITQNARGTLPPPPSKNNLKSKSVQNILSNVDPNSLKSFPAQIIPAVPAIQCHDVPEVKLTDQSVYPPSTSDTTTDIKQEERDENIENIEQTFQDGNLDVDESHSWTNFSDDDRGLISTTRKAEWCNDSSDGLSGDLIDWDNSHNNEDNSTSDSKPRKIKSTINGRSSSDNDSESSESSITERGAAARQVSSSPAYDQLHNADTDDGQEVPNDDDSPVEEDDEEEDYDAMYAMSPDQRDYYCKCFATMQPDPKYSLSGPTAKRFLEMSGLPVDELSLVWSLSDINQTGQLSLEEFCIAMHLTVLRKNQVPLPNKLPAVLNPVNKDAPFAADLDDEDAEHESSLEKNEPETTSRSKENVSDISKDYHASDTVDSVFKVRADSLANCDVKAFLTHGDLQTLKSRPRPKRSNTLPSGLLPPVPPPRNRPLPPNQPLDEKSAEIRSISKPNKLGPDKQAVSLDQTSPISLLASRTAESPVLNLEGIDRRTLQQRIRQEKERNHTLLRLNNELITELNEVKEQRINLNIQLKHLRPPELE